MIHSYQDVATQYKELDLSMDKIKVITVLLVEKVSFQREIKRNTLQYQSYPMFSNFIHKAMETVYKNY